MTLMVMLGVVIPLVVAGSTVARAGEPARPGAHPPPRSSCIDCHSQLEGETLEPTKHVADDIHFLKGLSCHDCHGGNPQAGFDGDFSAAHDEKAAFRGKPARRAIPEFCARCHSDAEFMKRYDPHVRVDQLTEYRTSMHGRKNAEGNEEVAVCVDCHGVHGIRAVSDTRSSVHPTHVAETCAKCHAKADLMKTYGLPADQYADYKTSVHARALYEKGDISAPTCNDCHGSHGAIPPGVENVRNVCGSCHGREATLFRETEAKRGLDLEPCIRCLICHGNHAVHPPSDEMLGVGPKSTCTGCHSPGEPTYDTVKTMGSAVTALSARLGEAREILDRAARAGIEVSPDQFALKEGEDKLVEARVLAHGFDLDRFLKPADEGKKVAENGVAAGNRAFAELRYRRMGLSLSLIVIVAVIGALVFKIRQIEAD